MVRSPLAVACHTLGLAVSLSAAPSYAQQAPAADAPPGLGLPEPARSMTMAEALAYAREHQPAIHAALSRVAARAAAADVASGQWLPTVAMTAQLFGTTANNTTATYVSVPSMDLPRIGATAPTAVGSWGPYPSTLVGVGALQEIFDFGRIGAQRAAADALVDVEKHRADGGAARRRLRRRGVVLRRLGREGGGGCR